MAQEEGSCFLDFILLEKSQDSYYINLVADIACTFLFAFPIAFFTNNNLVT